MKKSFAIIAGVLAAVLLVFITFRPARDVEPTLPPTPVVTAPAALVEPPELRSASAPRPAAQPAPAPDFGAAASEVPRTADFTKIVAFNQWAQQWQAADAAGREAMQPEGLRLARERRPEFKALIVTDPQRALEQAVSRVIRQDLPAEITAVLEKPVSATGDLNVYRARTQGELAPGTELTLRYFETPQGASYKARVFGELVTINSQAKVPLRGVAVDREFAVAESPVRSLERGERIPQAAQVVTKCPVSNLVTPVPAPEAPVTDATPVVEIGEEFIVLCNGTHVRVLEEQYRTALQASGPGGAGFFYDAYPGTSSNAIGNFRCLYIRVTYPDQLKAPNTEDSAATDMRNVARYYLESSYGRMTTTSTITPLIVLPHSQAWYIAKDSEVDGLGLVHSHARSAARKLGYDSNQFTCNIVRVNGGPRLSGISWGGGSSVWVSWDGMDVLNHECGHSLGRNHANYWNTTDGTAYGAGANAEYGNGFDVMGGGGGFGAHYNTISKRALGWLSDPYIHRPAATANGVYRIFAYDQPQLEEGRRYALRVAKDSVRNYHIEYHPAYGGQLPNSALVIYNWSAIGNAGHLLDTTPGTPGGKGDGGIAIGRTYSDFESDQHFTVLAKNATTPPSLDIQYLRGPFPGNQPPTLSVSASATTISAGGSVTFTATATDPDGDALAYWWDFNDGVASTNAAVVTRTFPVVDQMTVLVTVSDGKGGTARRHVVVNVGAHGRGVVTGNISVGGQPLAGVLIKSDTSKYCYTDSSGNYALSDLTTGARTLTATYPGHTFTPSFANPLTVTTGTNTADWTAAENTFVTLAKTADAPEGGANGSFALTRAGDTAADLIVRVAPVAGTATLTTDYTFTPALTDDGSFRTFTIPAGQSSLVVNVTPVNDTSAEGPETISLQLVANGASISDGPSLAILTLNDNDTTLPQVSVVATDPYASEAPGDTGKFVLSRTGSTASALNVVVAYSGTASNGPDYATLATTLTIPANQASLIVNLTPANDTAIEGPEDATLTISSNAAYVRDTSAQTATVNITDDDSPVVSVTALDASASEAGSNSGVFLLTRTGSTAAPLTVYYGFSGSALHGTDYASLPGQITFPIGAVSVPVVITPYDDDLGETDPETVTLSLTTFDNKYSLGTAFSAVVNIADNDDIPVVTVRAGTSPSEPSTAGTVVFRAIGSATGNITVHYTLSGTATGGSDFTAPSGTVTISANGTTDATVSIPILDDALPEDTESIIVTVTPDPAYRVYNDGTATLRLKDNDSGDRVMVSAWHTTPAEAASAAGKFYFSRGATVGDLTVNYAISGTAENGTDYAAFTGTIIIPDTASGADLTLTPVDDALAEGSETVTVTVLPGAGYGPEIPASATLYITDNETLPTQVGFTSATGATTEAPGALGEYRDIAVTLNAASAETVTVEYTSGGGTAQGDDVDWTFVDAANGNAVIPGGVLTFAPGQLSQNVRIRVKNDGVAEGNETALLTLRNARFAGIVSARTTHTLTISDANNPAPRVRFLLAASTRAEPDGNEPLLMAVLDRALTTTASVDYTVSGTATAGSDYTLTPGTVTFAAGETVKLLPLAILSDAVTEPLETVEVTLANPVNAVLDAPSTHTVTIRDSVLPAVGIAAAVAEIGENAGAIAFTVTRTGATSFPLTVAYTFTGSAVPGSDYVAPSGTLTLPTGASSAPLPITLVDDSSEEPDETVVVTISANAAYDLAPVSQATTTILDDDTLPVVDITSPVNPAVAIPSGVGLMLTAQATRDTPSGVVTLPHSWSQVSGPGTVTFESASAGATAATFSASGSYVLRATATQDTFTGSSDLRVDVAPVLTAQVIGTSTAASSWSETDTVSGSHAGGTITLTGASTGISSSGLTDGFYFLAAPVTGDFDFAVRIASLTNPGASASCRFGLMARASTATNAPYAMSFYRGDGAHGFQARLTAGTDPYDSYAGTYTLPQWVRLVRAGDSFSAYYSTDGLAWTQRGTTQSIAAMGASPLVGLAITSAVTATASTAVFDGLNFFLPTNRGPVVDAGVALTGPGPWLLNATVSDDSRPIPSALTPLWQAVSGAGVVEFFSPSSVDTGVSFSASGSYRLRLTVGDGAITTFDETTANITAAPLLAWRQTYFGTTLGTGDAANLADEDGDGWLNIVEYGLLTSPTQATVAPYTVAMNAGNFVLTLNRDPQRTDVTITIESCATLGGAWTPVARSIGGAAFTSLVPEAAVAETGTGPVGVTITVGTGAPPAQRFFHVKVQSSTP